MIACPCPITACKIILYLQVLDNQKRDGASLQDSDVLDAPKILADSVHDTSLQEVCQKKLSSVSEIPYLEDSSAQKCETLLHDESNAIGSHVSASHESIGDNSTSTSPMPKSVSHILSSSARKAIDKPNEPVICARRPTIWGRTSVSIISYYCLFLSLFFMFPIIGCYDKLNSCSHMFTIHRRKRTFPWSQLTC